MKRIVAMLGLLLAAAPLQAQELNVHNWSEYLPETVLTLFTRSTGIKVNYTTYESNEEMYEQVKNGGQFDLVFPSTYFVSKMRTEGLLRKLDRTFLPNFAHMDERLLNQRHDPGNEFSVPYLWGTTGLFFDGGRADARAVGSWADLWRPEYRGKVMLTDDMREVFHVALRALGYSGNSTDPKEIEAAYRKLVELKPNVREYNSESPKDAILHDGAEVGVIWNGEAFLAHRTRFTVQYVYPKEGAILWMDNLVIPKHAKNVTEAHQFIDFLMKPSIAVLISESIGYATPNRAARKEVDSWVRGSPIVYPDDDVLKNAELQVDVGDALALYEQYWQKLQD